MTTSLGRRLFLLLLLWFGAGLVLAPSVRGQEEPNQAGLLIQHGDGSVFSTCVAFEEPAINGLELLRRADVSVSADSSRGLGVTVCALDGEGCNYPEENCFCQCQGASCVYWQYWRLQEGEWQYSQLGATETKVSDGSVYGWVWAEGDPSGGQRPPATSFGEICASGPSMAPSAAPTRAVAESPEGATTSPPTEPSSLTPFPAGDTAPQPTSAPAPSADGAGQLCSANYLAFLAIVVVLAGVIVGRIRHS